MKHHHNARQLADRLESAAAMQKKTERNKIFMEVTYPFANEMIESLRELVNIADAAQVLIEGKNSEFDQIVQRLKAKNIL